MAASLREEAHHRHDAGAVRLVHQPAAQVGRAHPSLLRQRHRWVSRVRTL